ncbi:hypothetical protein ACFX2I_010046 [Malus domestica]
MGAIILYFQSGLEIGNQTEWRELTAALVMAKGYKSFSYSRTSERGCTGHSR